MSVYQVIPAQPEHISLMSGRWREADIRELQASSGSTPEEAIAHGLEISMDAWTAFVDGDPICIFGVAPLSIVDCHGAPWMIGTVDLERHAMGFLRRSKKVVDQVIFRRWDRLTNFVDARNETAIQWLKWLGFDILPPETYGVAQLPFHRFERVRR